MARDIRNCNVYNRSFEFALKVYDITANFPNFEKGGLMSQMRRAAVSIPCNIAEGSVRPSQKEYLYFLCSSLGSAKELQVLFRIANHAGYIPEPKFSEIFDELDHLTASLFSFVKQQETKTSYKFFQQFNAELRTGMKDY